MEHIDCVYYINLDHREDRRKEIEGELDKLEVSQEKRVRISGIYKPGFGNLGCSLAHKNTIEVFLASPHTTCLILEDDFKITMDNEYFGYLLRSVFEEKISFDCLMLGGNIFQREETEYPFLHKVIDAQTTSAYIITREFAPKLLQNVKESTSFLEQYFKETGEKKHEYCLDIYWKKLQPLSRWYILNPKLGYQRESYSDIEEKVTNYGV